MEETKKSTEDRENVDTLYACIILSNMVTEKWLVAAPPPLAQKTTLWEQREISSWWTECVCRHGRRCLMDDIKTMSETHFSIPHMTTNELRLARLAPSEWPPIIFGTKRAIEGNN